MCKAVKQIKVININWILFFVKFKKNIYLLLNKSLLGGYKYVVTFLIRLHHRNEKPTKPTIQCHWNKSNFSKVCTTMIFIEN